LGSDFLDRFFFCIYPIRQQRQLGAKKATLLMGLATLVFFALDSTAAILAIAKKQLLPVFFSLTATKCKKKTEGVACWLRGYLV
jgi:hypothetical protein